MKTRAELVAKNSPRQFMLDDPHEVRRLMLEAWGYLHTCHHKHGTDWEGRDFVMKALDALAQSPGAHLAISKALSSEVTP